MNWTLNFIANGTVINSEEIYGSYEITSYSYEDFIIKSWLDRAYGRNLDEDKFTFKGLFLDEAFTQPLKEGTILTGETTVYVDYYYNPVSVHPDDEGNCDLYIFEENAAFVPDVLILSATDDSGAVYTGIESFNEGEHCFKEIIIPEGIKSIGDWAFSCVNVEKVVIPASVKYIGERAFAECTALKEVEIYSTADFDIESVFADCENLGYEEYGNAYYLGKYFMDCKADATYVEVRPGCETLPDNAFADSALEEIVLPDGLKTIGGNAFANTKITGIDLPETVERLKEGAFRNCTLLESIVLPEVDLFIGSEAFMGCSSLSYIDLNRPSAIGIGDCVFKDCTSLKEVVIHRAMAEIGEEMFMGCSSLTTINLDKIIYISDYAFSGCASLEEITTSSWIEEIGKYAFV